MTQHDTPAVPLEEALAPYAARTEQRKAERAAAAEPTRNARLAELAALAHEFLAPYVGLPEIAAMDLDPSPSERHAEIELQLWGKDVGVREVAEWARVLGTAVRVVGQDNYVECCAWSEIHGRTVKVWTHITHGTAWRLVASLGLELAAGKPVFVDPDRLLELLAAGRQGGAS